MKEIETASAAGQLIVQRTALWWLIWLAGGVLGWWLQSSFTFAVLAVSATWLLFSVFTLCFFSDPTPRVPTVPEAVVAPAHGLVDAVTETMEPEFMSGRCIRLSIFLSVFDVHVQHAPIAGRISFLRRAPGRFLSALRSESAQCNENVLIGIESLECPGERMAVRQIAGLVARRIVSWADIGDTVARGQGLGLIRYGSRCDLYLPQGTRVSVKVGDRVAGGETVVATRPVSGVEIKELTVAEETVEL